MYVGGVWSRVCVRRGGVVLCFCGGEGGGFVLCLWGGEGLVLWGGGGRGLCFEGEGGGGVSLR